LKALRSTLRCTVHAVRYSASTTNFLICGATCAYGSISGMRPRGWIMQTDRRSPIPAATGMRAPNNHNKHSSNYRRLPPFGKSLAPSLSKTFWCCIGSEAWGRGKSQTWFPNSKVVLPLGEAPSAFDWHVANGFGGAAIIADGMVSNTETITELAQELLVYFDSVLFIPSDRRLIRFSGSSRGRNA
jgi:hypothetical protein